MSQDQIPYFEKFVDSNKIKLILHGANTDFFKPKEKDKDLNKFRCITVGHWQRDFDLISKVVGMLENNDQIEFIFVTSRKAFADKTGLENKSNVRLYRDGISDEKLLELYNESDILFLPLVSSTANNAIIEAISCGLPVISSSLPSVNAYIPGKEAVLVENKDPDKYVDIILRLSNDPEKVKQMGTMARRRAEELDWKIISDKYIELYKDLTGIN